MSLYRDHVLPRVINRVCATKLSEPLRERACAPLAGRVVEIGFGSGLNVPHYPSAVTSVDAVDPSDVAWHLAADRVSSARATVTRTGRDAQDLAYDDDAFDTALSTWTMCTVPDAPRALAEIRRVLKPGGELRFVEHGRAPEPGVRRWQNRATPTWKRITGGCHLNREIDALLAAAGFELTELVTAYAPGPKILTYFYTGRARARPSSQGIPAR